MTRFGLRSKLSAARWMATSVRLTWASAAVKSLEDLIASEMRRLRVPLSEVRTHRELAATACPGSSLQAKMNSTRSRGGRLRRA